MKPRQDHPGVYPPPPLFYVAIFFLSILIQRLIHLSTAFFEQKTASIPGFLFIGIGIVTLLPALLSFLKTKNTLITIKPASSLQTSGIYAFSRNPMYLGLLFLYTGIAFFKGNWWTFLLIPLVIIVISTFVIANEEKYLERAFGETYLAYKKKVRRWI